MINTVSHSDIRFLYIGDEVLEGDTANTNHTGYVDRNCKPERGMAQLLREELGLKPKGYSVVGDDEEEIINEIMDLTRRCTVLIITGGTGSSIHDKSLEALEKLTGRKLTKPDRSILPRARKHWDRQGLPVSTEVEKRLLRQGQILTGAKPIPNEMEPFSGNSLNSIQFLARISIKVRDANSTSACCRDLPTSAYQCLKQCFLRSRR
jgi:molybdopterin-biosynthesis enzyme MoeA-like protein